MGTWRSNETMPSILPRLLSRVKETVPAVVLQQSPPHTRPNMTILQLHLTLPFLLDMWPLISDLYPSCCLHIANYGGNLHFNIQTPFLLSGGALLHGRTYLSALLHALTSTKCLLTIISLRVSGLNEHYIVDLLLLDMKGTWGVLQKVRPQTYPIVTQYGDQTPWLDSKLLFRLKLYHWPEIFVLQPKPTATEPHAHLNIKLFCWYCRYKKRRIEPWGMPLDVLNKFCS